MKSTLSSAIGWVAVAALLALSGCGGGGGGGAGSSTPPVPPAPPPPPVSVSGVVSKGPVSGATGIAFRPDGTELGRTSAPTGADGSFTIDIGGYQGVVILEFEGGSYLDEATDLELPLGRMRAVISVASQDVEAHVTPLTEAVLRVLEDSGATLTPQTVRAANAVGFGSRRFDVTATLPADLRAAAPDAVRDEGFYGLVLAAVSRMQDEDADADSWQDLAPVLAEALADGRADELAERLADSLAALAASDSEVASGISAATLSRFSDDFGVPARLDAVNGGKLAGGVLELLWVTAQFTRDLGLGVDSDVASGSTVEVCEGGEIRRTLSAARDRLDVVYADCRDQNVGFRGSTGPEFYELIDGEWSLYYDPPPSADGFAATMEFSDLRFAYGNGLSVTLDGRVTIAADTNGFAGEGLATYDLAILRSDTGLVEYRGVRLGYDFSLDFFNTLAGTTSISGVIEEDTFGRALVDFDAANDAIAIIGADDTRMLVKTRIAGIDLEHYAAGQMTAAHRLYRQEVIDTAFFATVDAAPEVRSARVAGFPDRSPGSNDPAVLDGEVVEADLLGSFFSPDAELLSFGVTLLGVEVRMDRSGLIEELDADDPAVDVTIEALAPGRVVIASDMVGSRKDLRFLISATDPAGASVDFEAVLNVYTDTDGDGQVDYLEDGDDDGDGVGDIADVFPLDATESADADLDGVGDNADPDDDNDGVADVGDAYPFDARCHRAEDGDGERCRLSTLWSSSEIVLDADGIAYVLPGIGDDGGVVWPVDAAQQTLLDEFEIDLSLYGASPGQLRMTYVESHDAIYVRHSYSGVSRVDLSTRNETPLRAADADSSALGVAGEVGVYVMLWQQVTGGMRYSAYDVNGDLAAEYFETIDYLLTTRSRYTEPQLAAFCADGFFFDADAVAFVDYSNAGGLDCEIFGNPLASPDGELALTSQNDVLDSSGAVAWSLDSFRYGPSFIASTARWVGDRLVLLNGNQVFVLGRDGTEQFALPLAAGAHDLLSTSTRLVVVTRDNFNGSGLSFVTVLPVPQ